MSSQTIRWWSWERGQRIQRAGVVEQTIMGCDGVVFRVGWRHVPQSILVKDRQLSLFDEGPLPESNGQYPKGRMAPTQHGGA